jgi:hypothetical protein
METARRWSRFFNQWPEGLAKRGLVTTTLNELIPFRSFMLSDDLLLLERTTPDANGSRFIVLTFESIDSLKLTDAVKESVIRGLGFVGHLAK